MIQNVIFLVQKIHQLALWTLTGAPRAILVIRHAGLLIAWLNSTVTSSPASGHDLRSLWRHRNFNCHLDVVRVKRTLVPYESWTYPIASHLIKLTVQSHFIAHLNLSCKLFLFVSFREWYSTRKESSLFKGAQSLLIVQFVLKSLMTDWHLFVLLKQKHPDGQCHCLGVSSSPLFLSSGECKSCMFGWRPNVAIVKIQDDAVLTGNLLPTFRNRLVPPNNLQFCSVRRHCEKRQISHVLSPICIRWDPAVNIVRRSVILRQQLLPLKCQNRTAY
jgi:hypothetical protein